VPRPSSRTVVGLGTLESDPPTTPPRGLDLRGADTSIVLTEIRALSDKIDALIDDVRGLDAHQRSMRSTVDRIEEALQQVVATTTRTDRRVEDIARRLGVVERAPREGSSPQLEALASLALEDAETEVRARKARAENRARAWAYAWKALAFVGPIVGAVLMRECG
jgi:chromosome segregation ATPase